MSIRTPLARVRGLGSARSGTDHFWATRVTSVALIVLTIFLLWLVILLVGADYQTARRMLAQPLVAVGLLLLIVAGIYHMYLGMQVIIEDYVHGEGLKITSLMLNTFFCIFVGLACVYAVLKLSFGA
jgi:succinate dehydrogenase / fumarate reductase membrane anchor subunit